MTHADYTFIVCAALLVAAYPDTWFTRKLIAAAGLMLAAAPFV